MNKQPGTMMYVKNQVMIYSFRNLTEKVQEGILQIVAADKDNLIGSVDGDNLFIKYQSQNARLDLCRKIGQLYSELNVDINNWLYKKNNQQQNYNFQLNNSIQFAEVFNLSIKFAKYIRANTNLIADALQHFETYNVVLDEIARSTDYLANIDKNADYFSYKIHKVLCFLPLNQPLYSLICFGVIPSFMAQQVFVRPPTLTHGTFKRLTSVLNLGDFFPNLKVEYSEKYKFISTHAPTTNAVIFTGKADNGNIIRKKFNIRTLFILNGAGHNPFIVANNANLTQAVKSTLRVCLYNQGQDCSAPNAVLVNENILVKYQELLISELQKLERFIGPYENKENIIGPNTDPDHVIKIAKYFAEYRNYCVYGGDINPITGMIKPTVFVQPLKTNPNYKEFFAPVIVINSYSCDSDLKDYFENENYKKNSMYVTLFGDSAYVESLKDKGLHTEENILHNTDLHVEERGFLPYGGLGLSASYVCFNGSRKSCATLPPRDIYMNLIYPHIQKDKWEAVKDGNS